MDRFNASVRAMDQLIYLKKEIKKKESIFSLSNLEKN
jgi:hypothetical protein